MNSGSIVWGTSRGAMMPKHALRARGGNDLATTHPDLIKQWSPANEWPPDYYTPSSIQTVLAAWQVKAQVVVDRFAASCVVPGALEVLTQALSQRAVGTGALVTFVDLSHDDGAQHQEAGWSLDGQLVPDYRCFQQVRRVSKSHPRAQAKGWAKVFDAGRARYTVVLDADLAPARKARGVAAASRARSSSTLATAVGDQGDLALTGASS